MKQKNIDWDETKSEWLKIKRGYSFEEIHGAMVEGKILADIDHPNKSRYPSQRIFIVEYENYAHVVPYVEDEKKIFLKTLYPSRKFTKKYLTKKRRQ